VAQPKQIKTQHPDDSGLSHTECPFLGNVSPTAGVRGKIMGAVLVTGRRTKGGILKLVDELRR
jgi:hypothetical protein